MKNRQETPSGRRVPARQRLFEIIQIGNGQDTASRVFDIVLVTVIVLNILVMVLQTFDRFRPWHDVLYGVELFTVIFFCLEYICRIITADFLFPDIGRGQAIGRFVLSFDGMVDLLTILPFFFLSGFVVFRMLRVVRIFHLFRINAHYDSFNVIRTVIYEKRNQLASSVFIILVLMLAASITMYSVEHEAQPENFRNALSGMWWAVSALLTIGYGDIYPVTLTGRILAVFISFLGVGVVALPTGIISAGFVEQYTRVAGDDAKDAGMRLQSVVIDVDSAWIGESAAGLAEHYRTSIVCFERNRRTCLPDPEYNIQLGDVLTVWHLPENASVDAKDC